METIDVRVNDNPPGGFGHLYVVYTDSSGHEYIVRGGPFNDSILQPIDVELGRYTDASRDWEDPATRNPNDNSRIVTGNDLSEYYLRAAFQAQIIEQAQVNYDTLSVLWGREFDVTNSNTVATSALLAADITFRAENLPSSVTEADVPGMNNFNNVFEVVNAYLAETYGASISGSPGQIYNQLEAAFIAAVVHGDTLMHRGFGAALT